MSLNGSSGEILIVVGLSQNWVNTLMDTSHRGGSSAQMCHGAPIHFCCAILLLSTNFAPKLVKKSFFIYIVKFIGVLFFTGRRGLLCCV